MSYERSSRTLLLTSVLTLIFIIKIMSYLINNTVYSVDSWPLIRLSEHIAKDPTMKILDLQTYHAKYPVSTVFSVIFSETVGVDLYNFYAYIGVLILSLALTSLVYVLISQILEGHKRSLVLLSLVIYTPFVIYTSAYLKEVYSYPLALTLLLLYVKYIGKILWPVYLLLIIVLIMTHPLSSLMTAFFLATYVYISIVRWIKTGQRFSENNIKIVVLAIVLTSFYMIYNLLVKGLPIIFTLQDLMILIIYGVSIYGVLFIMYPSRKSLLISAPVLTLIGVSAYLGIAKDLPLQTSVLSHVVSLILLTALVINPLSRESVLSASILAPLTVSTLYVLTYAPWLSSITHRFLNYLVIPIMLSSIYMFMKRPRLTMIILMILLIISVATLYNTFTGKDPLIFYWRYVDKDLASTYFIKNYVVGNVLGSVKYSYLMGENIVSSDYISLSHVLERCISSDKSFIINSEEIIYGVPFSPLNYLRISENLFLCNDLLYNNLYNYIFK